MSYEDEDEVSENKKSTGRFLGLCATIANKLEIDVFLVRVMMVLLIFFTTGGFFFIYLILGMFASEA